MSSFELVTNVDAENPVLHDLRLVNHQLSWIGLDRNSDEDQAKMVLQRIKTRLMMIRAEWYQDLRLGTPWREQIFDKRTPPEIKRAILRQVIQDTPGVTSVTVTSFELDPAGKTGTMSFEATTDRGFVLTVRDLDVPFIVQGIEEPANG